MPDTDHVDEASGSWEPIIIPVTDHHIARAFSTRSTYTLRNLRSGAVYDIVARARNQYGWSDQSKIFNFFNKGVGKCARLIDHELAAKRKLWSLPTSNMPLENFGLKVNGVIWTIRFSFQKNSSELPKLNTLLDMCNLMWYLLICHC